MSEETAKAELEAAGYVVVKARTYRNLQERARIAEREAQWEREQNECTLEWGRAAHAEQRRLADRLTFVYGAARGAGCTAEQLVREDA